MDFHSLVAAHLTPPARPTMDASDETNYYRYLDAIRPPRLGRLTVIASAAGLILLAIGAGQA